MTRLEEQGAVIVANLARFGRMLREAGLEVGPSRIQDALKALTVVDLGTDEQTYWALRCTLVSRHVDIGVFDDLFATFCSQLVGMPAHEQPILGIERPRSRPMQDSLQLAVASPGHPRVYNKDEPDAGSVGGARWSPIERLRALDFGRYSETELRQAANLIERIAAATPLRRSRRLRTAPTGPVFDSRRTLRNGTRTDGYPMVRAWRRHQMVPRKLLFAVDVSGSMEPYARAMMIFLQAAVRRERRVEAFTFGTRLSRVTHELEGHDPNRALANAARAVPDWAGGTQIGVNLKALNDRWGRLGLTRSAVVVIVSDGWERGDVGVLAHELERLHRMAYSIVWVNPLAGVPSYEPVAQGMAAALPYIDHLLPGNNIQSLETLAEVLESLPLATLRRPVPHLARAEIRHETGPSARSRVRR